MSGSFNKVIIIGRLGSTPELKYTPQGVQFTNFNMATNESYTSKSGEKVDQTEWHRIVVWQRQAENVCKFLQKGSLAMVEGRLQTRKWQNNQGHDRYTTEIVAQYVTFLGSKQTEDDLNKNNDGGYYFPDCKQQGSKLINNCDEPPF